MYGFFAGFSFPESIFAEKILISCFATKTGNMLFFPKTGNMLFFPKIALFHINCYLIGKVSPMYSFLAGFSSPESIFAEKNTYFLFCNQNRKYVIFPKIALFHINCYFIGKVSPMYGFFAGFSFPESIFAEKNTYFLFCNQNRKYVIFPKNRKYVIFSQNRIISHQLLLDR